MNCTLRREEIFRKDTIHRYNTCGRQMWLKCALIRDSTEVTITFSPLSMLSKHALDWAAHSQERERGDEDDGKDNSRRWKMSKKFAYWQRKEILQLGCAETLEKVQHQPLFYVFHNEGFNLRMVQLKNDIWKQFTHNGSYKWIDILPCVISNYNARKYRTIGMRPVDVTPAIARLLTTICNCLKIVAIRRVIRYAWTNLRQSLIKVTRRIETRRYLKLSKYNKLIQWRIF